MPSDSEKETSKRLGHDPLAWLEEDSDGETPLDTTHPSQAESIIDSKTDLPPLEDDSHFDELEKAESTSAPVDIELENVDSAEVEQVKKNVEFPMEECLASEKAKPEMPSTTIDNSELFPVSNNLVTKTISIASHLIINDIEALHKEWGALNQQAIHTLHIDASVSKYMDTSGVQLLFSLVESMQKKSVNTKIINPSPEFEKCITTAGLHHYFSELF